VRKSKFKVILSNQENKELDVEYELHDSILAEKWIKKIKHLKRVAINPIESQIVDVSNLQSIYNEFCEFANLQPIDIKNFNQDKLNQLHKVYEDQHEVLSKRKNNEILYKFHHSIHHNEGIKASKDELVVGWGVYEGPLTEQFNCYSYYAHQIEQNNIYLPWSELGKKPFAYYTDKEPNNQKRVNELCKPHTTFRAKFFISFKDITPSHFTPDFSKWFDQYKQAWFEAHNINEYTEIHEYSAPLLAHTYNKQDLTDFKFIGIEI
jgi:hypothetical protein|tara:strand:- start:1514 stop:2305 length:792 start_codon:yes stop_codon:yes gene_type:complete